MSHARESLERVRGALIDLATAPLTSGVAALLARLGYASPKTLDTGGDPRALLGAVSLEPAKFDGFGGVEGWRTLSVVFQLTGDELPALSRGSAPMTADDYRRADIDSFVFLALDLADRAWTRRELVGITRELNRGFAMPAVVAFRYSGRLTLSVIDRRRHKRDASRDVVGGRISLIKDVDLARPHRAHLEILADLGLSALRPSPTDFRALYDRWLDVLSAAELNKRFYRDLADWFAWASAPNVVHFTPEQGNGEGDRQIGLIRLLTRLMFVWFVRQKDLVPSAFFERDGLGALLAIAPHDDPDGHGYYPAVLQNLFFACLNTEMDERGWLPQAGSGVTTAYLDHSKLRQRALFTEPDSALKQFRRVPFLNGGLFDCLDVEVKSGDPRWDRATQEVRATPDRRVLRVDGFSEAPERQPRLPNRLFFGGQTNADLSHYFGKPTRRDVGGLIDLFERYKFTVEENTPLEEEAALDPELLGKVFENLLASYNEDTKTTARNKSGSFYTPREVVDFMVDEALVAYLAPVLAPPPAGGLRPPAPTLDFGPAPGELTLERPSITPAIAVAGDSDPRLLQLLSWSGETPAFSDAEADALVAAIERCRAIDPAVGSGAFPLGLLQKLVHVLSRLDPGGAKWKAANRQPFLNVIENARAIKSPADRAAEVTRAEERLSAFDAAWPEGSHAEYARKLYLIEGCLHGVDIQPIAVQIAKLRCFISLAVEQDVRDDLPNRGVLALPNLELKFVAANALGLVGRGQMVLRSNETGKLEEEWRDTAAQLFSARDRHKKRALKKRFEGLRHQLKASLVADGMPEGEATLMARWDPFDANGAAAFFSPEWMFGFGNHEGGCFDVVLANPPYVRQEKIESYLLDGRPANPKKQLAANYATAAGTADLLVYFFERAVRLLKPGGVVAFITSNKWYRAAYGAKLRSWLSSETRLSTVIDFGDAEVFEAIAYPTIVVAEKRPARVAAAVNGETFRALNWTPGEAPDGFPARFATEAFAMPQTALLGSGWQLEPQGKRDLLAHLRVVGMPLGEYANGHVFPGVKSGLNEAYVIDSETRRELIAQHPSSADVIKPYLRGRDLKRWRIESKDSWIIFIPWHFPLHDDPKINLASEVAAIAFKQQYPAIFAHISKFREKLSRRDQSETGIRYEWYAMSRFRDYWREFMSPKIIMGRFMDKPTYAYDDQGYFTNDALFVVTRADRYLLSVLNSSVSWWFLRSTSTDLQSGFIQALLVNQKAIPVPPRTDPQAAHLEILVRAIEAGAERPRLEALINAYVYELFFPQEVAAAGSPFTAAREAGLERLATLNGLALARAAEDWSRTLSDPGSPLHRSLFALQSLEPVRIIEGRS
ncbi:Eco57I restriction-modification methylase domain-containing protein [Sphingomonas sp. Leaf37]|uniref:Eco57I restriction-modification methylase domain-containing protein n=1 Tax=Sphingomonas sp. Leaf37 TaxID=2876552 RepID=UPI001E2FE18D|nr:TaqI-like C-terminal specificity domain-containing protein [Sphingomonas sp. Leaf37]